MFRIRSLVSIPARAAGLAAVCTLLALPNQAQAQSQVLFVNFGIYTADGVNFYNEVVNAVNTYDPGGVVDYVLLPANPGGAAALIAANDYDQIWVYDLSHQDNNWHADYQAIADWWLNESGRELIADGRILSSYWGGRYPTEGRELAANYFVNLMNEGGGMLLSTDHNVYANDGANDIAAAIGIGPFTGIFGGTFPVDQGNPLMSTPNAVYNAFPPAGELKNDSSTGQAPFGLQPNGLVLDAVGYHSGNTQTPGISSTIDGTLNMVLEITAPADGTTLCSGDTVLLTTSVTGNPGPVTYQWTSSLDGLLGTDDTLLLDGSTLSAGVHVITVLATSGSLVDDADISVTVGDPTVCGPACQPTNGGIEVCDGVDNDCNDSVDDGIAPVATSCGVGACAGAGTQVCVDGQLVDDCQQGAPTGDDSDCDGIDDDCDGSVDEHHLATPTACGLGACAATGEQVCFGGTLVDTCQAGDPTQEVCGDDIDNDCDGSIDAADCDDDCDGDGIGNCDDLCHSTVADAPTAKKGLGVNRWITDGQTGFVTKGKNPTERQYSLAETGGCSCFQIVAYCGYGDGHTRHGCSISVMDAWTGKYDYAGQEPGCKP